MRQPGLFVVGDGDGCDGYDDGDHAPCERVAAGCCLAVEMTTSAGGDSCGVTEKMRSCSLLSKGEEKRCCLNSSHLNLSFNHGLEL